MYIWTMKSWYNFVSHPESRFRLKIWTPDPDWRGLCVPSTHVNYVTARTFARCIRPIVDAFGKSREHVKTCVCKVVRVRHGT